MNNSTPEKEEKEIEVQFEPELFEGEPHPARKTGDLMEEGVTGNPEDLGPSGDVGLPETATSDRLRREENLAEDHERLPSDMASRGNRDAGDQGVSGGLAAGEGEDVDEELAHERRRGLGGGTGDPAPDSPEVRTKNDEAADDLD